MQRALILLAGAGSAALMGGALAFQYLGDLPPCQMCIWQRYPHVIVIVLAALALAWRGAARPICVLAALLMLIGAGIGVFHAGVEWKLWEGITACSGVGNPLEGLTGTDLLSMDAPLGVVRCDEAAWRMFGISMAGYNAVISAGLALIWLMAARIKTL